MTDNDAARLAVADRGATVLQAGRLLLEEGHWEAAAGVARQLFELLVNIEYLIAHDDVDAAWETYTSFGQMATARSRKRALDYSVALDYQDDDGVGHQLDGYLAPGNFDEFRDKNGKLSNSWSHRTVAQLAELSPNPLRKPQYDYYYRTWSEQAHASPSALIPSMLPQEADGAIERILERVYRETRDLIVMMISSFSDLLIVLGNPPIMAPSHIESWRDGLERANEEWGRGKG